MTALRGIVGAVIKRLKYGNWQIIIEVKSDKARQRVIRKLRLMGIYVKEKRGNKQ